MAFVKGKSGNPSGRPRMTDEQREALEMLRAATPAAARYVVSTVKDQESKPEIRLRCAEIILDRVYGKAAQPIAAEVREAPETMTLDEMMQAAAMLAGGVAQIGCTDAADGDPSAPCTPEADE